MISIEISRAIDDLLSRYSYGYDCLDWDLYASVWTDDATLSAGAFSRTGKAEILRWAKDRRGKMHEQGVQSRHYQTNTLLTELSDGVISARTLLLVTHQDISEPKPELVHTGVYHDRIVQAGGVWFIANREIQIDHA